MLVDVGQAQEAFPDDEPDSSFERLAWAYRNEEVKGSFCDIKSTQPRMDWLTNGVVDVFLVHFSDSPDLLYAVPRERVSALYSAAYSVRLTRPEIATAMQVPRPALAPFAVLEKDYTNLVSRLVHGEDASRFGEAPYPGLVHGATGAMLKWRAPAARPLRGFFDFQEPKQSLSFQAVMQLYEWLRRRHPTLRFHQVCTQPLAGDFDIEFGSTRVKIQHKIVRTGALGDDVYSPAHTFDFLMVHHGPVDRGYLEVTFRGRPGGDGGGAMFTYTGDGADRLVRYPDTHKHEAVTGSVEATACLPDEEVYPLAKRDPSYASQRREEEYNGRMRLRAHQLAMHMYRYVNEDPDGLQLDLACIYLNWDQEHPFGAAIVVRYYWTDGERELFRRSQILPASLHDLPALDRECVVLRFSPREFRHVHRWNTVFPLQQLHAELPVTDQKFFLISPPDEALTDQMPVTIMLFPSGLIRFPAKAKEIWRENRERSRQGVQTEFQLALLTGHTQEGAGKVDSMIRPGTALPDFWVTPGSALRHLDELLRGGLEMAIQPLEAHDLTRLTHFRKAAYITDTRAVLQAAIDYGPIRLSNKEGFRPYGYWHNERLRETKRKAGKVEGGEEGAKPGGGRPRTAKQRKDARKARPSLV